MSLGDSWATTAGSTSKLNLMTVPSGSGAYLDTLDKSKHKIVVCTATSGTLTVDHVYVASADGTQWIDLADIIGGSGSTNVIEVFLGDPKFLDLALTKTQDLKKAQWIETVTSTGTIEDYTDGTTGERGIRLRPNGTSGASAQVSYPHLKLDFSKTAMFQTKLQIETATSMAFHTGVGADDITAADSTTRKFQPEFCTTTNNNWWLRTANGSAQSGSDSGIAISTSRVAIRVNHYPTLGTPETDLQVDTGTLLQKTTNIPITSATADNNLIKHSVKNSTAADRPIKTFGSRLSYTVSDNWV